VRDVLCARESASLKLKDKHRLRVFGNRVLRNMFGHKTEQLTGEWRKPSDGRLHDLCFPPNYVLLFIFLMAGTLIIYD
jgi:hypothetical protein